MNARLMPDALPIGATCRYEGSIAALCGMPVKVTFVTQAQRYNVDVLNADGTPVTNVNGDPMVMYGVHHASLVQDPHQIVAALPASAPVVEVVEDSFDFVQDFLVPTKAARDERKARNRVISETLQTVNLPIGGECWTAAQTLADSTGFLSARALKRLSAKYGKK